MGISTTLRDGYNNPEPDRVWLAEAGDFPAVLDGIQTGTRNGKDYVNLIWRISFQSGPEYVGQRFWLNSDTDEKTRALGGRLRKGLDQFGLTLDELADAIDGRPLPRIVATVHVKDEGQTASFYTVVSVSDAKRPPKPKTYEQSEREAIQAYY